MYNLPESCSRSSVLLPTITLLQTALPKGKVMSYHNDSSIESQGRRQFLTSLYHSLFVYFAVTFVSRSTQITTTFTSLLLWNMITFLVTHIPLSHRPDDIAEIPIGFLFSNKSKSLCFLSSTSTTTNMAPTKQSGRR
jgi:hypothetical protein